MFQLLLIIIMCAVGFWLLFKFFKIFFRFFFYMVIATLVRHFVISYTSYTIDDKWFAFIAIAMFILALIRSNTAESSFSFWEWFTETTLVRFFIAFLKILFRFFIYMIIVTPVWYLILKFTPYSIDNKWFILIAITMFILALIKSDVIDTPYTFWEWFTETKFVQIFITFLKIVFRFIFFMIIATLVWHLILRYTSYTIDNKWLILVAIVMFTTSIIRTNASIDYAETDYVYFPKTESKDYILNTNSGIIHSKWDSSADEISEEHQVPLSSSDAINLVSNDSSVRFKRNN